MSDERMVLAEAMGKVVKVPHSLPYPNGLAFQNARGEVRPILNPAMNANDCEILIAWLNRQQYEVNVLHWEEGDACVMIKRHIETTGKRYYVSADVADWKQGVFDLALKAIRDHQDSELKEESNRE